MENDLPVSNPPTVDDALRALLRQTEGTTGNDDLWIVRQFLTHLTDKAEPESIFVSDGQGYILESAYQNGFEPIDDNADLLVVHQNDLIKYVTAHRGTNKAANALKKLVEALEEMGIADPDQAMGGADTVDVICKFYPQLKAAVS